jgi:hypothetical protein
VRSQIEFGNEEQSDYGLGMNIPVAQTLRPNPWKTIGLIALCGIFVLIGVWLGRKGEWMGWATAGFFGLGVCAFAVALLPGSSYLHLDAKGFEVCSLFRKHAYQWTEIEQFDVAYVNVNRMVVFNFSPTYTRSQTARKVASAIVGWEGALHDGFSLSPDELAKLMEYYRQAAVALDDSGDDAWRNRSP